LLEISDFQSFFSSNDHLLHCGNDIGFPFLEVEIRHFLSTSNDQKYPLHNTPGTWHCIVFRSTALGQWDQ